MISDLIGRKAIVTGSSAGIGRAIAERLLAAGASVVISGRGQERVIEALAELKQQFADATIPGVAADLATAEGAAAFFPQVPDVDILVNNVGSAVPKAFVELTDAFPEFERSIAVVEHPEKNRSGSLRLRGGVPIVSAAGTSYAVRNR